MESRKLPMQVTQDYIKTNTTNTRNSDHLLILAAHHDYFQKLLFPSAIKEWNKLDRSIKNCECLALFKKRILKITRPKANSIYNINNPVGIKHLSRLRLVFSHLKEHNLYSLCIM